MRVAGRAATEPYKGIGTSALCRTCAEGADAGAATEEDAAAGSAWLCKVITCHQDSINPSGTDMQSAFPSIKTQDPGHTYTCQVEVWTFSGAVFERLSRGPTIGSSSASFSVLGVHMYAMAQLLHVFKERLPLGTSSCE